MKKNKFVPIKMLLIFFCICLAGAYVLVPKDKELFQRLLSDGKTNRAVELVQKAETVAEGKRLETVLAEAAVQNNVQDEVFGNVNLLKITFDSFQSRTLSEKEIEKVARILSRGDDIENNFAFINYRAPSFSEQANEVFYVALGRKALASDKPGLAAQIFIELGKHVKEPSSETVRQMAAAFRFADQPERALEAVQSCKPENGMIPGDLRQLKVTLLLELNRPGEAFDLRREEFTRTDDLAARSDIMSGMVSCAMLANREKELFPLYRDYLSKMPEDGLSIDQILSSSRPDIDHPVKIDDAYIKYAYRFALLCEWNDDSDTSFIYYKKLAALGDRDALKHCAELSEDRCCDDDMMKLLVTFVPVRGDDSYTLMLARMLAEEGQYSQAERYYAMYLAGNSDNGDILLELGAMHEETDDLKKALTFYKKAMNAQPGLSDAKLRAASLLISQGRYDEALEIYRLIPEKAQSDQTLEEYMMLSESLGRKEDLNQAMQFAFRRQKSPGASDYSDLAETYNLLGDMTREILVLRQGVEALPGNQEMALMLADALYRDEQIDEAALVLSRINLKDNMQAMAMFIELCGASENFTLAESLIPEGIEKKLTFPASVRIELAQFYEQTGRTDAAERLFESVPEDIDSWQFLASVKFREGDLQKAEEYQIKYLASATPSEPMDWILLGDIYAAGGKTQEAAQAYERSLHLIKKQIGSRL